MLPIVFTFQQDCLNYFCYKLTRPINIVILTGAQEKILGNVFFIGLN